METETGLAQAAGGELRPDVAVAVGDESEIDSERSHGHPVHLVEIIVNEHSVRIEGPHTTGLKIKEAAIRQGVHIELDFALSEEQPGGRTRPIGDADDVIVRPGARFHALAPDDNS